MIRNLTILSLFVFLLAACSPYTPTINVDVKVARQKESGTWHVSYNSEAPFTNLNFDRQRFRLRSSNFRILTPGVRIVQNDFYETVQADKPIHKFELEFDDRLPGVANDYPIVSYFSDGGAVLYTGHLLLKIPECSGCKVKHHFQFTAPEGESVITEDNENEQGDFVYFGEDQLTEYDSFNAVTDRSLPDWIQRQIERSIPTFLIHYQEKLKIPLAKKPLVFVAYDKAMTVTEEGYIGGVVGSHMQLVLVGRQWADGDGERYEKFAHLTAHEVFHFWNGALYLAPDEIGGSWLHEGSADAIADYVLYELGYYGDERYHQVQTERLNRCLLGIAVKPLPKSDQHGFYRNFYECGATMNHIIERRFKDGRTLFDLWRAIFSSAQDQFYQHDRFFTAASSLVSDGKVVSAAGKIAAGETGEPSKFIQRMFDQIGIEYSVANYSYPSWYQDLAYSQCEDEAIATSATICHNLSELPDYIIW